MIYMVEMDMGDAARLAEWHAWYLSHLRVLLTVPGFRASQRFAAVVATPAPYLALHQVDSPALFDSEAYRGKGGPGATGDWRAKHTNWQRNLLDGLAETPEVALDAHLAVIREARDLTLPAGTAVHWLRGVGLDRTIDQCGLAVIADPAALVDLARRDARVCIYRPISEKLRAAG